MVNYKPDIHLQYLGEAQGHSSFLALSKQT